MLLSLLAKAFGGAAAPLWNLKLRLDVRRILLMLQTKEPVLKTGCLCDQQQPLDNAKFKLGYCSVTHSREF